MKRLICMLIAIVALISIFAVPAMAMTKSLALATANNLDSREVPFQFTRNYYSSEVPNSNQVQFVYQTAFMQERGKAKTTLTVPTGGTGWVFTFISYNDGHADTMESYSTQNRVVENGKIYTEVSLRMNNNATRTNHFASLTVNEESRAWDYYYTASGHGG